MTKEEAKEHRAREDHVVFEILSEVDVRKLEIEELRKLVGGGNGSDGDNRRARKWKNIKPNISSVEKLVLQKEDNIR
ncbi:MAG: hypothetical protein QW734_08960 [Candidatus Bathyarchaeia archaeon]